MRAPSYPHRNRRGACEFRVVVPIGAQVDHFRRGNLTVGKRMQATGCLEHFREHAWSIFLAESGRCIMPVCSLVTRNALQGIDPRGIG